jgi:hypothetical protein
MAMQVTFAPGYIAPSRVKVEEQLFKQQLVEQGLEKLGDAAQKYFDVKRQQSLERLGKMEAMAATYGASALGQSFRNEFGQALHSYGIDMEKDKVTGDYQIPDSFEAKLRTYIGAHPEMLPALLGTQKPELSPGEKQLDEEKIQLTIAKNEAEHEAAMARVHELYASLEEKIRAVEAQQAGATKRTEISTEGKIDVAKLTTHSAEVRAQIAADAKKYGVDQMTMAKIYGVDEATATKVLGITTTAETKGKEIQSKEDIAVANKKLAYHKIMANPNAAPSGMYNWNGKIIDSGTYNLNKNKYPGATQMTYGQWAVATRYEGLKDLNQDRIAKLDMLRNRIERDAQNGFMRQQLQAIGLAMKGGNQKVLQAQWGQFLTEQNRVNHLGWSDEDIAAMSKSPGAFQWFSDLLNELPESDPASPAPAGAGSNQPQGGQQPQPGGPTSTTTTSTKPPMTTTTPPGTAPGAEPNAIQLDENTTIYQYPMTGQ